MRLAPIAFGWMALVAFATAHAEPVETVLIYEAQPLVEGGAVDLPQVVRAVGRRVRLGGGEPLGVVRSLGDKRIEVRVPAAQQDKVAPIEKSLQRQGLLEFRVLAERVRDQELVKAAEQAKDAVVSGPVDEKKPDGPQRPIGRWVRAAKGLPLEGGAHATRKNARDEIEVLVVLDEHNVTSEYLTEASPGFDERGQNAVFFTLNKDGAKRMLYLTMEYQPDMVQKRLRRLAIILDGEALTAPGIVSKIGENGQIAGRFSREEVGDLAQILNGGVLPARLRLVEKTSK